MADWLGAILGSKDSTGSAGVWPFMVGTGRENNFGSFARQYAQPTGYNVGQYGTTGNNTTNELLNWFAGQLPGYQGYTAPSYLQPTAQPAIAQSAVSAGGVQPAVASGVQPTVPGAVPQTTAAQAPAYSPGGGNNLGNYYFDFQKNNTIPVAPEKGSQIPGVLPSAANEFLNGPAAYYPHQTVAGKTGGMQNADDFLNLLLNQNMAGQGTISAQIDAGNLLTQLAGQAGTQIKDPYSANINLRNSGLTDFLNYSGGSPGIDQVIANTGADMARYMNESLIPKDRSAAIGAGQYGSSRSGIAEGITRRGVGEEFGQMAGNMRYQDYQNWLANKLRAGEAIQSGDVNIANALTNQFGAGSNYNLGLMQNQGNLLESSGRLNANAYDQQMNMGDTLYQRGTADRALNQALIDADKAQWDYGQNAPMDWISKYMQVLQGAPATPERLNEYTPGLIDYTIALANATN